VYMFMYIVLLTYPLRYTAISKKVGEGFVASCILHLAYQARNVLWIIYK